MNKIRRKNLQSIIDQLEELKGSLEDLQAEEEEYRDNIPENMQESERYEKADEACDNLSAAVDRAELCDAALENLCIRIGKEHHGEYLAHFLVRHRLSSLAYIWWSCCRSSIALPLALGRLPLPPRMPQRSRLHFRMTRFQSRHLFLLPCI